MSSCNTKRMKKGGMAKGYKQGGAVSRGTCRGMGKATKGGKYKK